MICKSGGFASSPFASKSAFPSKESTAFTSAEKQRTGTTAVPQYSSSPLNSHFSTTNVERADSSGLFGRRGVQTEPRKVVISPVY